jgi:hypothetical protein
MWSLATCEKSTYEDVMHRMDTRVNIMVFWTTWCSTHICELATRYEPRQYSPIADVPGANSERTCITLSLSILREQRQQISGKKEIVQVNLPIMARSRA